MWILQSALPYANAPAIPASMYMKIYLGIPTALSAYPPRYTNARILNARWAMLAWMNNEDNKRVKPSEEEEEQDETDNNWPGMKP